MKLYDISMLIHEGMQVYKEIPEKKPVYRVMQDHNTHTVYESEIKLGVHTGTHVDANLHMLKGGDTIDHTPLDKLVTPCRVLDLTHIQDRITEEDLKPFNIQPDEFILLKTRNSDSEQFDFNFVFVEKSGAAYLSAIGIKGVGTDGLGIERSQPDHETHEALMKKDIVIVEGLRLKEVPAGNYFMAILPLKIRGAEAAPARAVLIEGLL